MCGGVLPGECRALVSEGSRAHGGRRREKDVGDVRNQLPSGCVLPKAGQPPGECVPSQSVTVPGDKGRAVERPLLARNTHWLPCSFSPSHTLTVTHSHLHMCCTHLHAHMQMFKHFHTHVAEDPFQSINEKITPHTIHHWFSWSPHPALVPKCYCAQIPQTDFIHLSKLNASPVSFIKSSSNMSSCPETAEALVECSRM